MKKITLSIVLILIFTPILFLFSFNRSRASSKKAQIFIDLNNTQGTFPERFKALAQGGEEQGRRMLENVTNKVSDLSPKYIRIDHIYDFYNVVKKSGNNNFFLDWTELDQTICDIYKTGAKPFLVLGYMPQAFTETESIISPPKNWDWWSWLVQKTIERYSGIDISLCNQITGFWKTDIFYEVWNEPDLETFGKWSIHGGEKDYRALYFYSIQGALQAKNVYPFKIGGPATTKLYKNWITKLLDFVINNNLRIDFISWHHYSKNPEDYGDDLIVLNQWLTKEKYRQYQQIPKIISEWGFDSDYNPIADTQIGAAYTVSAIRNFINYGYFLAFLFEIKDGPLGPSWGILTYDGFPKPRYNALKLLNSLKGEKVAVLGEGKYVKGLASFDENKISLVLSNYDPNNLNIELVPITFTNLKQGLYQLQTIYLDGRKHIQKNLHPDDNYSLSTKILLPPNEVVLIEVYPQ